MVMKTIVILHGWDHSTKDWLIIKDMFDGDFRVVSFDLPGFGDTPLISPNWGIPEYSNWTKERIKKEVGEDSKIILLGHSFGGRIASHLASQNPDWLESLVLYSSPSIYRPRLKTKIKIFLAKLKNKIGLNKINFHKNTELKKADESGLGKIFRKVVSFDQTDHLPKIKVKTLVITGEKDESVPLYISKEIDRLIPDSRLAVIDKVGHNAHKENHYLFYGIIKQFIQNN